MLRYVGQVDNRSVAIRRIVVGVDGSPQARRAAEWAADLARGIDAEVVAVHALGLLPLRDAEVRYRDDLREGNPVTALLDVVGELDADIVVVGSRGVGGFPGLLLGSTSTQVAQHTRRPVVIVPDTDG